MKEIYEAPELEIIEFSEEDIIQTSGDAGNDSGHDDEGGWNW